MENDNKDDVKSYTRNKNDLNRAIQDTREELGNLTDEEFDRLTAAIAKHPEAGFASRKELHDFVEKAKRGELEK